MLRHALLFGCLLSAALPVGAVVNYNYGGDNVDDENTIESYNALRAAHTVSGNMPHGAFVEVPDATCPGTGTRIDRVFYGSSWAHNGSGASEPQSNRCDTTAELGDDFSTGGLLKFVWTAWGANESDPAHVAGDACTDQGLGTIDGLFVCSETSHWNDYYDVRYTGSHPLADGLTFVRPANIVKASEHALVGIQKLRTWGCEWAPVSSTVCKDESGAATTEACTAECYKEFGCAFSDEITYTRLLLEEMVAEVELDPLALHPPDVYLWKPLPGVPDGMPADWETATGRTAPDWHTDSVLESRLQTTWSPYYPTSLKAVLLQASVSDDVYGDLIGTLTTDNFGPEPSSVAYDTTYIIFDDHATAPVNGVTGWESGSYRPEDPLSLFRMRMSGNAGGGTWVILVVDDCDNAGGQGSQVVSWQLHFVCSQQAFCKCASPGDANTNDGGGGGGAQNRGSDASGSGDPHMVGFKGQMFDYHGAPGRFFNIVSTPKTLFNAFLQPELLDGLTYMGAVGIMLVNGSKVQVSAIPHTQSLLVELNDLAITADTTESGITVTFLDDTSLEISVPELVTVVTLHKEQFIDVKSMQLKHKPTAIHGVLGNTANLPAEENLAGEEADYFVSDMWATDFPHNVFTRSKLASFLTNIHALPRPSELNELMIAKLANY